jgi:AraC-like DNA-binding protein
MDALTGLLDGPRARGAFLLRAIMEPPWSVRIKDRAPDATVGSVARQVGYGSAFALSTAFKRVRGLSPREHRLGAVPTP